MKITRTLVVIGVVAAVLGLLVLNFSAENVQAGPAMGNVEGTTGSTVAITPTVDWALAGLLVSGLVIAFARPRRQKQVQE